MNSFVLALASIALVLVNMWIGWALAKYHTRRHPQPAEWPLPAPPVAPEVDDLRSTADLMTDEAASTNDPEHPPPDFSMSAAQALGALATADAPQYH
ncbi:MAG: hypothetical protein WD894_18515 [Pirellulales bacterium]